MFVRKLAAELRPGLLDDLGLIPALEWHSKEFEKRFGVQVNFKSNTKELNIPPEIATGVFRIYQESLTNIARHSEAKNVVADLEKNGVQLKLSVSDNGKGFPSQKPGQKKTLGLLGMKERAHMIGGKLDISSEQGKGTTVTIVIPI
jgi:signal transduction histidine kinase